MKSRIRQLSLILFLLIGTMGLHAQEKTEQKTETFNLEQAMEYALQHSYVLKNTRNDIEIAHKKVWETISTGLPQVSGTANFNRFLNLPVSLIPGEFFGEPAGTYIPVKFGQDYSADFGFSVSQQIFDGSWLVGVESATLYLDLARQANEKNEIDIRNAVAQAYYLVLVSEQSYELMQESLHNTEKLYEETKAYFENGFREEQDLDQLRILVKNAENEVLKAKRELQIARTVLKYTMGYNLDAEITLSQKLEDFVAPLTQTGQPQVELKLQEHIDYRMAMANFKVSEKLLKLEKTAYLPKLSAFYSYSKTSYSNNSNLLKEQWFPSSLVGIKATIPIFNSGMKRSRVQQAKLEVEKSKNSRELAEITLKKDYLTAKAELETAREQYQNMLENRDLAESILDKTKIKFNNGIIGSVELTQQESQYINSVQQLVASTLQLLQADLKLKKAAGAL